MVFRKVPNPSLHSHCMKHLCIVSCMFAAMQSNFPTEGVLAFFPRPQLSEPHLRNDERYELIHFEFDNFMAFHLVECT